MDSCCFDKMLYVRVVVSEVLYIVKMLVFGNNIIYILFGMVVSFVWRFVDYSDWSFLFYENVFIFLVLKWGISLRVFMSFDRVVL